MRRIVRRAGSPIPANQAQVDSAVAQMREMAKDVPEAQLPAFERMVSETAAEIQERLSHYNTMPAFYALAVDQSNRIWVRTSNTGFEFDVYSPEGSWVRSVTLPSRPLFLGGSEAVFFTQVNSESPGWR